MHKKQRSDGLYYGLHGLLSVLEIRDWFLRLTGKENPRLRNREACTGGKLQDGWRMAEKRRILNIQRYAISLSNCPKLSDNPRIKTVEYTDA